MGPKVVFCVARGILLRCILPCFARLEAAFCKPGLRVAAWRGRAGASSVEGFAL